MNFNSIPFCIFVFLILYNLKYFTLLLLTIIIISCSKEKKISYISEDKNSAKSYFSKYKLDKQIDKSESELNLVKSYNKVKSEENNLKTRKLLSDIIAEFYNTNNSEKLNESSKLLIQLSSLSHDSLNLGMGLKCRGVYFHEKKLLDSSYYFYLKAEKIYSHLKSDEDYAKIVMNKGIIQYLIGDFLGAEISFKRAHSIFKKTNNYERIYSSLSQLGLVAIELKEYEKGVFYFDKAIESIDNLPNEEDKIYNKTICYNNIGYLYLKSEDYRKGTHYFEEALKNKSIIKEDPILYSNLIDNLAYCRLKSNISTGLPNLFFEALQIRGKLNDNTILVGSNIHISEYYFFKKDYKSAILYSKNAIEDAKKSKIPLNNILALKQASIVDKENASKYSDDYIRISDSLQLAERKNKDRFARIELETEEIRQERDDFEEKSQYNLYYLFGTISFFIILIAIRTQRSRNRVIALKQAQQKANEDIYKLIISQQGKLQEGRELEKARIARELHDGVLGRLFGLRLNLDGLNDSNEEAAIAMRLNYINELKLIEQDIREISHELSREKLVLINNFVSIINNLIDEQSKVHKADIKLKVQNTIDWDKLSNIIKINLYRILQESLQNINKHAEAKNVKINFNMDRKNNLVLKVVDDGKGFHVDKNKPGIGIKNILGRVNECKGVLDIKSEIGKGTKIIITVPFENNTQLN